MPFRLKKKKLSIKQIFAYFPLNACGSRAHANLIFLHSAIGIADRVLEKRLTSFHQNILVVYATDIVRSEMTFLLFTFSR